MLNAAERIFVSVQFAKEIQEYCLIMSAICFNLQHVSGDSSLPFGQSGIPLQTS